MNLRGHPRGHAILRDCVEAGIAPELVIEESSALASRNAAAVRVELRDHAGYAKGCPSLDEALGGLAIRRESVANHNDRRCVELVAEHRPDVVLLGDTRLLRPPLLAAAAGRVVNIHPGYLPRVRGNTPYVWAAALGLPQGCTSHFVDAGVDTGAILLRSRLATARVGSYPGLILAIHRLCGRLARQTLTDWSAGTLLPVLQRDLANTDRCQPTTYMKAPEWMRSAVKRQFNRRRRRSRRQCTRRLVF